MYSIVTIALATRLKRKVFLAKGIEQRAELLIKEASLNLPLDLIQLDFLPYGFILTASNPKGLATEDIAYYLRKATSSALRHEYPELQSMPSLWTRDFFTCSGGTTESVNEKIRLFYDGIKSR